MDHKGIMRWVLPIPVTVLCLMSIGLSLIYLRNLVGPEERRLTAEPGIRSIAASLLLLASMVVTWRSAIAQSTLTPRTLLQRVAILLSIPSACYYAWYTRVNPASPVDFVVGVAALMTIAGQLAMVIITSLPAMRSGDG